MAKGLGNLFKNAGTIKKTLKPSDSIASFSKESTSSFKKKVKSSKSKDSKQDMNLINLDIENQSPDKKNLFYHPVPLKEPRTNQDIPSDGENDDQCAELTTQKRIRIELEKEF